MTGKRKVVRRTTPKPTPRYRRADNGQYTTERYANKHKRTTVKESK
jgi:hypothetical protein